MVKELNNMKNKKSNSYKPYDSSNSFVRRVTSKVSELLPQSTSWLSRILAREPEQAGPVESVDQAEDEESVQPPSSKRMRTVHTCTDFPLYHNNVGPSDTRRLEYRREEELSPIRSYKLPSSSTHVASGSQVEDINAPGPSGLHTRHRFIASTPAVPPEHLAAHSQLPKVNGEDASDSDSGSRASSLAPDATDHRPQGLYRTLSVNRSRPSHRTARDDVRNSLVRSKQLKLDESCSSLSSSGRGGGRVSFDTTVFNSPFKGRLCGGLSTSSAGSRADESLESPFYRSNVTYGGSSSCHDSLLRTRTLHSEVPIVVQPSQPHRSSDNLGSSTKKILKALEQFSTPMLDQSRRIDRRSLVDRGIKRRMEVPYKELVIPQMPDLLRIKRRDARHTRPSSMFLSAENRAAPVPPTKITPAEAIASESSSSHLSLRLSKSVGSKEKPEAPADPPKKIEEMKAKEPLITGLPLTSLPKFDTDLVKQTPVTISTVKEGAKTPSSKLFTFSKPISLSEEPASYFSIPPKVTFSQPLDPNDKPVPSKTTSNCIDIPPSDKVETMSYIPPTNTKLKKKENATVPSNKMGISAASELKSGSVLDVLSKYSVPITASSSVSVTEVINKLTPEKNIATKSTAFKSKESSGSKWECQSCYVSNDSSKTKCAACEQPKATDKTVQQKSNNCTPFGDIFKLNSHQWECNCCLVKNDVKVDKCVACGGANPKASAPVQPTPPVVSTVPSLSGFGDKFKPAEGSWECSACLVRNKSQDSKCVSCCTDKPGASDSTAVKTAPSLSNMFKKPVGSWECDACLVRNKSEDTSCVSCGTVKPGAVQTSKPAPTFSFGIPPSSDNSSKVTFGTPSFTFGVTATSTDTGGKTTSSFIAPTVPSTQTVTPTFTFGIPTTVPDNKSSPSPASNSFFSNLASGNVNNKVNVESSVTDGGTGDDMSSKTEVTGKSVEEASSVTSSKQTPLFGNMVTSCTTTPVTSSALPSNTSAASSTLPIFVNQISSTKPPAVSTEKPSAPPTNPMFTFGSSSGALSAFGKSENSKPADTSRPLFGGESSEVKPMVTSPLGKPKNGDSEVQSTEPPKTNLFTFGSSSFGDKKPAQNCNDSTIPVLGTTTINSFGSSGGATSSKPTFTFTSGFGSDASQVKPNTAVNSFGSQGLGQQSSGQESGFSFKPSEPSFTFTAKKTEPSNNLFQFGSTPATNHTNSFNNCAAPPTTNQFGSGFGASSPFSTQGSIFGSPAPQPAQTASFLFGTSQTNDRPPPAPTFNFAAQSGNNAVNSVGNTSVAGGFTFGQTQNSAPVQPPTFDPNIKPVFNFTGGQTPIFSAPPATGNIETERKIRKAIRRTTQK